MARNGFRILDCDLHIIEPPDLWQRYTDERFRQLAPIGMSERIPDLRMLHPDGRPWGIKPPYFDLLKAKHSRARDAERYRHYHERGWSSVAQLEALDAEGIDVALLYPSRGLNVLCEPDLDPPLAAALARAYNNWLYDFCQADPNRLVGVAMISPYDITDAIAETRRAITELGFRGAFVRANIVNGRRWGDPYYDPLWETLVELDVPIGFHESAVSATPQVGDQFGDNFALRHAYAFPFENMLAIGEVIWSGVCERFPQLRIAFLEGNCGWLPWLLWRLDERWELLGDGFAPGTTIKPSAYFKRQCWVSVDCEEVSVKYAIDYLGKSDNIVFSTDFPHIDAQFPHASDAFLQLPISDEDKRKILWDNCAAFYGAVVPA